MPAKRAVEYRTKLLALPKCLGGADNAASLASASKLLDEAINDRALLEAGWELHEVTGLARSQLVMGGTDNEAGAGPIFVLVVFRRIRREGQHESS